MPLLLLAVAVAAVPLHASGSAPALASDAERVSWSTGVPYTYDGSGNVIAIGTQKYYYDAAGRLVYSTNPESGATSYTYDAFGNRKSCTSPEGGSCQAGLTVNSQNNRLAAPVAYDASGRVTAFQGHTLAYDAADMPHRDTFGTIATEYIYTADDERIAVAAPNGQWEWSLRGPSGKVIRKFASTGAANFEWRKDYIWRDELLLATRQREPDGAVTTYHYHLDHLGTPRRITDAADRIVGKSDYDPFGSRLSGGTNPPSANRMQFTGHERDTGSIGEQTDTLDYMHARYYSPYAGRFLSVDPVLDLKQAMKSPQGWNRYSYVSNNPVRFTDPTGKYTCSGTKDECKAFEASLSVARAAASEAVRNKQAGATQLTDIVNKYGKLGDKNGVKVVFGATQTGGAMETTGNAKITTVRVDRASFAGELANRSYVAIASMAVHEGAHTMLSQAEAVTTSRTDLMRQEQSAYRAQAMMYSSLGIEDQRWLQWSPGTGFNTLQINANAASSVALTCQIVQCTP